MKCSGRFRRHMGRRGRRGRRLLRQVAKAEPDSRFALVRRLMRDKPRQFFAELRRHMPILTTDQAVLVANSNDVHEVLSLPAVFTVDLNKAKMDNHMLAFDETTLNQRDKGIMHAVLNRDDLPKLRTLVGTLTDQALDAADGVIDLVPKLTRWVPLRMVEDYFGLTGIGVEAMARWSRAIQYDAFFNQPFDQLADAEAVFQASRVAYQELGAALGALLKRRGAELKVDPTADDIVARMLKMQLPPELGFDILALVTNIGGLLIGTVETSAKVTAHALEQLLARPAIFANAREVANRGDFDEFCGYVWEALRFHPFLPYLFRVSATDHVLARGTAHETFIPAGSTVLALTQSAMFDHHLVDEPETFRADRPYHVHALHLGHGHHRCLGDQIARVLVPEILRRLLLRPNLRATGPIDYGSGAFPEHYPFRYDRPQENL